VCDREAEKDLGFRVCVTGKLKRVLGLLCVTGRLKTSNKSSASRHTGNSSTRILFQNSKDWELGPRKLQDRCSSKWVAIYTHRLLLSRCFQQLLPVHVPDVRPTLISKPRTLKLGPFFHSTL
jgi:hypothetical protein